MISFFRRLAFPILFNAVALIGFFLVYSLTGSTTAAISAFLFAIGAAVGSFWNLWAYRSPRGMDLNHPPSHCPRCGSTIPKRYDVPLVGWLMLRGRCVACRGFISWHYPAVEFVFALAFAAIGFVLVHLCA
jgi:leader peptidase (prepilin peptidase) / N-methyltransferase